MVATNNDIDGLEDLEDFEDPDLGIELDKIEVPKKAPAPVVDEPPKPKPEIKAEVKAETAPRKRPKLKVAIAVCVIILVPVLIMLGKQFVPQFPRGAKPSFDYRPTDPILTNLGVNRQIKISLMVRYHPELPEHATGLELEVRDRILTFLTSPDTSKAASENDLETLKSHIGSEIAKMLKNDYNDDILLKELAVY